MIEPRRTVVDACRTLVHALLIIGLLALPAGARQAPIERDWLIDPSGFAARIEQRDEAREISLTNGLVRRVWRLSPNAATIALDNLMTGESELRGVRPEAMVSIDGKSFDIGGLLGQPIQNFLLPQWVNDLTADPSAWTYRSHKVGRTQPRLAWKPRREWMSGDAAWPPPGVSLELSFAPPAGAASGVEIVVHYELYDGIPLFCKWVTVFNRGAAPVTVDSFKAEILAAVEPASLVGGDEKVFAGFQRSIHVETDYAFGGAMDTGADNPAVAWKVDPLYSTQVNYERRTPCLLECAPRAGPAQVVEPGGQFETFRVFELVHDSTDRERRGLALRRMYRTIAPWVLENPLIFHARSAEPASVRAAIDQAAEVGFELVIMTFGSGFEIENEDPAYLAQLRELADHAHARGIALGGYSLLASRSIDAANDVINPATGKPGGFAAFGNSPCLGSAWGQAYFRKLYAAFEKTGLDVLEHDGSYPGDVCASSHHPGHRGLADSQWSQWRTVTGFYAWCRARGIYLNVPDWYYLSGSSKCAMGYRETNWSLPRDQQEIIERQNIHDGTWTKTPSMGWMFVPLTEYQGGGAAATIEPLDEHIDHYERRLMNLLGAGVQACFRGPRLYDTPRTRDMVKRRVGWYKSHRAILESDIIHGRRPDGRDIDWFVHVNPRLEEPAMLVVYNPTAHEVRRELSVDLSYSGLSGSARVTGADGDAGQVVVDPRGRGVVSVRVPARGMAWYVVRKSP